MDRRTRTLFALALVVVVGLTGGRGVPARRQRPSRDPEAPAGAQAVVGVIVGVDSSGLDRVSRASRCGRPIRARSSSTIGDLENGAEFPPGHLVEHQATAQPVRVWYRTDDGSEKVAVRLEDAT